MNNRLSKFCLFSFSPISEYSNTDAFCMVFMKSVQNYNAKSHISNVHVKYLAYGLQYNFEVDHYPCDPRLNLQNVEMMMFCQGKTGSKDTLCYQNSFYWGFFRSLILMNSIELEVSRNSTKKTCF